MRDTDGGQTWSRLERLFGSWLSPWYCPRIRSPAAIFLNFLRSTTYRALPGAWQRHVKYVCVKNTTSWSERSSVCAPDVVFAPSQVARPVTGLPEAVAIHLPPALTERSVTIWRPLQVKVAQLLQVCSHNLKQNKRKMKRWTIHQTFVF